MVSLCIKTNNNTAINYLMLNIAKINLDDIVFVRKNFSKYTNIIVHYCGNNIPEFYNELTSIITNCIIDKYEDSIIYKLLLLNYFYFDEIDMNIIKNNCKLLIENKHSGAVSIETNIANRIKYLWASVLRYISYNKAIFLDGFLTFRTSEYINCLDEILDFAVSQFVVNREYAEFIDMLRLYISSRTPCTEVIHLIYINEEAILLDKQKHVISLEKNNLDKCYLSDISFSANDYALNSLLSLLPSKLIIHLISPADDFINTLQAIFGNSASICTDCEICTIYRSLNKTKGSY